MRPIPEEIISPDSLYGLTQIANKTKGQTKVPKTHPSNAEGVLTRLKAQEEKETKPTKETGARQKVSQQQPADPSIPKQPPTYVEAILILLSLPNIMKIKSSFNPIHCSIS